MAEEGEDYEITALRQRLKASVHYTVGKICEEIGRENEVTFNKSFMATLAEATFRQGESLSMDLELFAKHAKRSTVNGDDMKLVVRKCPELHQHLCSIQDEHTVAQNAQKRKKAKTKANAKRRKATEEDESSNPGIFED